MKSPETPQISLDTLHGEAVRTFVGELAGLRTLVFREWPYLYDGDPAYEERYLGTYAMSQDAVVVVARARLPDGSERIVGASTALPATGNELRQGLTARGFDADRTCYFGESVLLKAYRGQGIGVAFFAAREAAARDMGKRLACFASVLRDPGDPRCPADHMPLDAFWAKRGYAKLDGFTLKIPWKEVGAAAETPHDLQVWAKRLES